MRVCFISFEYPPNVLGGAGTYAEAIVKGLRHRGVDVYVITRGDRNACDKKMFRVPTSNVPYLRRLFFMKPALSLLRELKKQLKFDLVHFNEPHIILRKLGFPTVCTVHSTQVNEIKLKLADLKVVKTATDIRDLILKSPVGSICDILTAHATDKIICPSPHLARLIRSYCFVDEERVCVIPNGIDLEAFDRVKGCDAAVLSKYDLERNNYILFIGRLSSFKGVQYLIAAFRTIKKEYANLKLAIVGTGDFENYLRNLAHGIKDVVFTGYVDSLKVKRTLYENSLVVVVPSIYDALPMVVLEAMAYSKPVIASNVGSVPLLIKHGKNGFLAKPGDSKGLERFVGMLYDNENLRKSMGSFGRKLVEKEFAINKMVDRTLELYKSMC